MMCTKRLIPLLSVLFFLLSASMSAQQHAVTNDGEVVILYNDGTWQYLNREGSHNPAYPSSKPHRRGNHSFGYSSHGAPDGTVAEIIINDEISFTINNGELVDFRLFSYDNYTIYDDFSGQIKRIGDFEVEYESFSNKIRRLGPYRIEYELSSGRVKRIGNYPIEYELLSSKISRVGNTRFSYGLLNGRLSEVRGETPRVKIYLH